MTSKKPLPPLAAIRKHCLECVGNYRAEVQASTGTNCPLWPYRSGINPYRTKMSEAERTSRGEKMNRRRRVQ